METKKIKSMPCPGSKIRSKGRGRGLGRGRGMGPMGCLGRGMCSRGSFL
jgi:hypothetical protein